MCGLCPECIFNNSAAILMKSIWELWSWSWSEFLNNVGFGGVARSRTWQSNFTFTFHFHALEKELATHSSLIAWRIPQAEEPDRLYSMGSWRAGLNLPIKQQTTKLPLKGFPESLYASKCLSHVVWNPRLHLLSEMLHGLITRHVSDVVSIVERRGSLRTPNPGTRKGKEKSDKQSSTSGL